MTNHRCSTRWEHSKSEILLDDNARPNPRSPSVFWRPAASPRCSRATIELDAARHPSHTIRMLLRRVANDARLDMYSACWRYGRNIHASPGLLATKVIINPSYNLEPVQTTSPKQASRELQFHPFSITREAPTTDLPSSFDIRFVFITFGRYVKIENDNNNDDVCIRKY